MLLHPHVDVASQGDRMGGAEHPPTGNRRPRGREAGASAWYEELTMRSGSGPWSEGSMQKRRRRQLISFPGKGGKGEMFNEVIQQAAR